MAGDTKTPEQLADEHRRDVLAFAYKDTDGKLYTLNTSGERVEAAAGAAPLSPKYQKIAEQTAAVMMLHARVLALNPEDRNAFTDLLSGKTKDLHKTASAGAQEAWAEFKKTMGGNPFELPGAETAGKVASGFSVLPTFISDSWNTLGALAQQLGGGDVSRDNAIAIGTAYASVRQVAEQERPSNYWQGLTSKKTWSSYAKGGFFYALDQLVGFVKNFLPESVCKWIDAQGWHQRKTLAECIDDCSHSVDNARVEHEMRKFKKIGGLETEEVAPLLARGGVSRQVDGRETTIAPAGSGSNAPSDGKAPATPDAAAEQAAQGTKPLANRLVAATENAYDATKQTVADAGTVGLLAGGGAFAGTTMQATRGLAEGVVRQWPQAPAARATRLTDRVHDLTSKIAAAKEVGPKEHWYQISRKTPEQIAAMERELLALKGAAIKEGQVAAGRASSAGGFTKAAQIETHGATLLEKVWNAPRVVGRWFGDKIGYAGESAVNLANRTAHGAAEAAKRAPAMLVETAPIVGSAAKTIGMYAAPVIESANLVTGIASNDQRLMTTSSAAINTIAAGVAAGAGVGALVGGVGAVPGAVAGLVAGSITAIGTSWYAGKRYDERVAAGQPEQAHKQLPTGTLSADPALSAAAVEATQRANAAAKLAAKEPSKKLAFAGASKPTEVKIGATLQPATTGGATTRTAGAAMPSPAA